MAEEHHDAQPQSVQVEQWEIEVAKSVARSFKTFPEHEDLEAELLKRLLELKSKKHPGVIEWRGFLAKSLYNAATDLLRRWQLRQRRFQPLEIQDKDDEDQSLSMENILAAPEEPLDLRIGLAGVWEELTPELRELWNLLVEEKGNKASLARRLGRPRKTVDYWLEKLRALLEKRGLGE